MNKNDQVIITKVGNGYLVCPFIDARTPISFDDQYIFQDKGYVSAARDNQPVDQTLFGWLDNHFEEKP